ncbi:hypothetical protein [Cellulomonas hominis]
MTQTTAPLAHDHRLHDPHSSDPDAPDHRTTAPTTGRPSRAGGPLRDEIDAIETIEALVGADRHGRPALWALVLDGADRPTPLVMPVSGIPARPGVGMAANLVRVMDAVLADEAPDGSVLVGYVRGTGERRDAHGHGHSHDETDELEHRWSPVVHAEADRRGLRIRAEVVVTPDRAWVLGGW